MMRYILFFILFISALTNQSEIQAKDRYDIACPFEDCEAFKVALVNDLGDAEFAQFYKLNVSVAPDLYVEFYEFPRLRKNKSFLEKVLGFDIGERKALVSTLKSSSKEDGLIGGINNNAKLVESWKVLYDSEVDNAIMKKIDNLDGVSKHLDRGVHSADNIKTGLSKASDKQKWVDDLKAGVYRNVDKAEYVNPTGNILKWTDQHPNSISQSIESALNSTDAGKAIEGKVGNFVKTQGKDIEGFGLKVKNSTSGQIAGDIDVMTKTEIIEVKKSYSSFKPGQVDKFTNNKLDNFLNPNGKNAILYIDELMTAAQKSDVLSQIPNNVRLVNSLEELGKLLN